MNKMNKQPRVPFKGYKGGPKRGPIDRKDDRVKMMMMMRRGATQWMIAEELGISQAQVSIDFKVLLKEMQTQLTEDTKAVVAQKLQEYAEVKKEAWEAWTKSKEEHKKRKTWSGGQSEGESEEFSVQYGNNAYLQTVLSTIQSERDLLGINPVKEVSVKGQIQNTTVDWSVLAAGIPESGGVPDLVEAEIQKVLALPTVPQDEGINGTADMLRSGGDDLR